MIGGALVDNDGNLRALSRRCGTVHNTEAGASTIQNTHIPIRDLSAYGDKGNDSRTM